MLLDVTWSFFQTGLIFFIFPFTDLQQDVRDKCTVPLSKIMPEPIFWTSYLIVTESMHAVVLFTRGQTETG